MGVWKEPRTLMGKRGQRTLQIQGCWEEGPGIGTGKAS